MYSCQSLINALHTAVDILPTVQNVEQLANLITNITLVINTYIGQCVIFLDNV